MSNETDEIILEEQPETVITETVEPEPIPETTENDLETDFANFAKTRSEHKIEPEAKAEQPAPEEFIPVDISAVEDFKLQIFLGLFFSLLDGIHLFLYRFISKTEINKDDFCLDDGEKASLEIYFKTKRVLEMINRLPSELIGIVHMEYLYYTKFQEIKKASETPKKRLPEREPTERKPPVKKKRKKKPAKKKATSE